MKAKPLQRGDAISVVAPAGPVNRERIDRALALLRQRGFRTKTYGDIYRARGYLAGDDATRADELAAAFADPETTAVWCARGGYGVARILERIDYDVIRDHPKVVIGFSDITALHIAIQNRVGLVTFHAPNLQDGFGREEGVSPAAEAALWRAVLADVQSASEQGYPRSALGSQEVVLPSLSGGTAAGRLTGGNLSVLCGLMGTPFELDSAGRVLFLEDVDEPLYRIDRYLAQLSLAGKLQSAAGILLGSFSSDDPETPVPADELTALLCEYLGGLGVPVVAGFPAGHQRENVALPMGATVELQADIGRVVVCENPVSVEMSDH